MDYASNGDGMEADRDAEIRATLEEEIRGRAQKEEEVRTANLEAAREALAAFAAERQQKIHDNMAKNRENEHLVMEQLASDIESENPWERIVSLVDLQNGMSDENLEVGRMRQVFIQLKNKPIGA